MKDPKSAKPLFDSVVYGVNHDAFDDRIGQTLLRCFQAGAVDEVVAEMIEGRVNRLRTAEALGQLSPFRKPRLSGGALWLGTDQTGADARIPPQYLNAGLGLFGNTGGGKTNLVLNLIPQLIVSGVNVWTSETHKRDLRAIRALVEPSGADFIILRARDWKANVLQAGRVDPQAHLASTVDALARVLELPSRAQTILRRVSYRLYAEFGIWNGRAEAWPCLYDVYEAVRAATGENASARDAILDRLGTLLLSLGPQTAAYRLAWNVDDLARHSIGFEMTGASPAVQELLPVYALTSLLRLEVQRGLSNRPMNLFTLFEDAQRLFDRGGGHGATPMDELAGVIRGAGKGIGVVVQTKKGFSEALLPNLATKIIGRLGSAADYRSLGADLAMTPEQAAWAHKNLRPGVYIAQLADGDWREPFILRSPQIRAPRTISDDEAAGSVEPLNRLPVRPAEEYQRWQPGQVINLTTKKESKTRSTPRPGVALSNSEITYLRAVVEEPGKKSGDYAKVTGLSGGRAAQARDRLVELGYIREHRLATGGRQAKVLEPLDEGRDALTDLDGGAT